VDEFSEIGLTPMPAKAVSPPLIEERPVNLECKVRRVIPLGSHDLLLGEIVDLHIDDTILGKKGRVDIVQALPPGILRGGHEYWSLGKKVGWYGYAKGRP